MNGANISDASQSGLTSGGNTTAALLFSTTSGFGIYFGAGAPSITAAKGSLYLASDGSSTNTRAYINIGGTEAWTGIGTVV